MKRVRFAPNPFLVNRPIQPGKDLRAGVLEKYARCGTDGIPLRCHPTTKVIFPDTHSADLAIKAFRKLGMDPMRPYICQHDTSHVHLTRKGATK